MRRQQIEKKLTSYRRRIVKVFFRSVLPHIALVAAVITYLLIGATIFVYFERDVRLERNQLATAALRQQFDRLTAALERTELTSARLLLRDFLFGWENLTLTNDLTAADVFHNGTDPLREIWSFPDAVLLAFTAITTIGYGVLTPSTLSGRLFCVGYSLFGIPLAMIAIANSGKFLAEAIVLLWQKFRLRLRVTVRPTDQNPTDQETPGESVSPQVLLVLFVSYVLLGALLLPQWEEKLDFASGFYLCFFSLTTVGFGDVYPRQLDWLPATLVYITVGLALTTMAIEVASEYLQRLHRLGKRIFASRMAVIHLGDKVVTIGELVSAIGRLYGLDAREIDRVTDSLDTLVAQSADLRLFPPVPPPPPTDPDGPDAFSIADALLLQYADDSE